MKITLLIFMINIMATSWASDNSVADQYLGNDREDTFNSFVNGIKETQIISTNGLSRLGTTWEQELEISQKRFLKATTEEDVYYALLSLQRSFHDTHSKLKIEEPILPKRKKVTLPFHLRAEWNLEKPHYVVIQSQLKEIPIGYHLDSMDSIPVNGYENIFKEWVSSHSPEDLILSTATWLTKRYNRIMPIPNEGTKTKVVFKAPDSLITIEKELEWKVFNEDQKNIKQIEDAVEHLFFNKEYSNLKKEFVGLNYIVYRTKRAGDKIIRYHGFNYDFSDVFEIYNRIPFLSYKISPIDSYDSFSSDLEKRDHTELVNFLKRSLTKRVIIDVRENGGGNISKELIGFFAHKPFNFLTREIHNVPYLKNSPDKYKKNLYVGNDLVQANIEQFFKKNPVAKTSPRYPFYCHTEKCLINENLYTPAKPDPIKPELFILSGPACISACDQFVAIIQDNKIGKVIGMPTRGGHAPFRVVRDFELKERTKFQLTMVVGIGYRPNGLQLEGNPATPDFPLYPDEKNQQDYLSYVLKIVENQNFFFSPAESILEGIIEKQTFAGPPNYENINKGDLKETGWFLKLKKPINVLPSANSIGNDTEAEFDVKVIHLTWSENNKVIGSKIKVGKRVKLKGTLFHQFNGHHHARVLLDVVDVFTFTNDVRRK